MQKMNRREERKEVLYLLFETLFREDESAEEIFSRAKDERELPDSEYIKSAYFTTIDNLDKIDSEINSHAHGRTASQMTKVTRSILRLSVCEMLFIKGIPAKISINEAVELSKEFEDIKVKGFINGILNAIYRDSQEAAAEKEQQ